MIRIVNLHSGNRERWFRGGVMDGEVVRWVELTKNRGNRERGFRGG